MKRAEYTVIGLSEDNSKIEVIFKNPFRTKSRENDVTYDDVTRMVRVQYSGNAFDKALTDDVIEQLSFGIYAKMELAHKNAKPSKKNIKSIAASYIKPEVDEPLPSNE
jgi:hypothetical protein